MPDSIKIMGTDGWYIPELMGVAGAELEGATLIIGADMSDPQFERLSTHITRSTAT